VKKADHIEPSLLNIERNPIILLISSVLTAIFIYIAWALLKAVNPLGLIMMIPAAFCAFQSLWLMLNPFAAFYADRIEIKQSLFHNQQRFFIDVRKVSQDAKGQVFITYNDDEVEKLNLFGIKKSHIQVLRENLEKQLGAGLNVTAAGLN
jgi:hypothetical protein